MEQTDTIREPPTEEHITSDSRNGNKIRDHNVHMSMEGRKRWGDATIQRSGSGGDWRAWSRDRGTTRDNTEERSRRLKGYGGHENGGGGKRDPRQ